MLAFPGSSPERYCQRVTPPRKELPEEGHDEDRVPLFVLGGKRVEIGTLTVCRLFVDLRLLSLPQRSNKERKEPL
jgi:hypothetical protein